MSVFPLSLCRLAGLRGAVPAGDDICIDVPASNPAALALAEDAGMVKVFEVSPRLSTLHPELRTKNFKPQTLQRYLPHKKTPTPLGTPQDARHMPTVGS